MLGHAPGHRLPGTAASRGDHWHNWLVAGLWGQLAISGASCVFRGVVLLYLEFASPPLLMLDRVRPSVSTCVYPQSPFFQNRQPNRFIHLLHSTALIHLSRELAPVVNNKKKNTTHDDALTNETTTKQAEHSRTHTRVLY